MVGMITKKALATDSVAVGYTAPTVLDAQPGADGVHAIAQGDLELIVVGLGADNDTFGVRVLGYKKYTNAAGLVDWVPEVLADLTGLLSTFLGRANGAVFGSTYRYADAYTLVSGIAVLPPVPANTPAKIVVPGRGFELLKVEAIITGTTTGVNALLKRVGE